MKHHDAIVVGGGLVGAAIAYGLQRIGLSTLMLDEGDVAFRASRGNFGLIWVQSKGVDFPPYARWTWNSAKLWPDLDAELRDLTGDTLDLHQPGGIEFCLNNEEVEQCRRDIERLHSHAPHVAAEMLDHKALSEMTPGLGPDVVGGRYSRADGHVNPLSLLRGLHKGLLTRGGKIKSDSPVRSIQHQNGVFTVGTSAEQHQSARLVLAAGLGTRGLADTIGLDIPVRPIRGQNLVTEKLQPFLSFPCVTIRQTAEGSVQIGASDEDVGFNDATTPGVLNKMAARAVAVFPHLKQARIVRVWGALRIMSPDGYPIYAQSERFPGAFAAVCHSGVTLAAVHALKLAKAISEGALPDTVSAMTPERFAHAQT